MRQFVEQQYASVVTGTGSGVVVPRSVNSDSKPHRKVSPAFSSASLQEVPVSREWEAICASIIHSPSGSL